MSIRDNDAADREDVAWTAGYNDALRESREERQRLADQLLTASKALLDVERELIAFANEVDRTFRTGDARYPASKAWKAIYERGCKLRLAAPLNNPLSVVPADPYA